MRLIETKTMPFEAIILTLTSKFNIFESFICEDRLIIERPLRNVKRFIKRIEMALF